MIYKINVVLFGKANSKIYSMNMVNKSKYIF